VLTDINTNMISDNITKKTATKYSVYSKCNQAAKIDAQYNQATSGTVNYPDGTSFIWTSVSALDHQYDLTNTLYKNLITSATDYTEIKALYLMSIQSMEEQGTYHNISYDDSGYSMSRRPIEADIRFIDWLENKINQQARKASGVYISAVPYV